MPSNARKVKCPYCNFKNTKEKVIAHIDKKHEDLIPEGYTAARVLFNSIHHIDHGTCVVCKQPTEWNENTNKYKRLCNNPKCREKLREMYKKNMLKVYGKTTLLNDANQQKKMLANRGISGVYTFQNGKLKEYTGSYEKKMLEFLDKIMGFDPDDIIMPGPTIDYIYKGEHHKWITDALIVPYNLVIEVKDGGDNPNKRVMTTYREKQIAKEEMITNMGTYNYIRLTNNQFEQLIEILYELKMQMLNDNEETRKAIIRVNEDTDLVHEAVLDGIHLSPLNNYEDPFERELKESMKSSNNSSTIKSFLEFNLFSLYKKKEKTEFDKMCEYTNDTLRMFNFFKSCKVYYPDEISNKWHGHYDKWGIIWPDKLIDEHIGDSWDLSLMYKYFSENHNNDCGIGFIMYLFKKNGMLGFGGHAFACFNYNGKWYIPDSYKIYKFNSEIQAAKWYHNKFKEAIKKNTDNRCEVICDYYPSDSNIWTYYGKWKYWNEYYGKNISQYDFFNRYHKDAIGKQLSIDTSLYERLLEERIKRSTLFLQIDTDLDCFMNCSSTEINNILKSLCLFKLK